MKRSTVTPTPFKPDFPSMTKFGENDYIVSWKISDWNMIHRIQDYLGMPRYINVNYRSKITIKRDDPKWNDFVDGVRKGFYVAYKAKMSANVKV